MADRSYELDPEIAEPPLLAFVRDYWQRKRGARTMPGRKDIQPTELKSHLSHILLADVAGAGDDFRYRLVGSRIQDYFAVNPTGSLMSQTLVPFGADTVAQTLGVYRTVVTRRAPLRVRGAGAYYAQGAKLFDALLAPLSDDGETANMILGTFLFEWDRHSEFAMPRHGDHDEAALARALQDA